MCKNPMCEHFGRFFDAVRDRAGNPASRYSVARKRSGSKGRVLVKLKCRGCGLSATVHAGPLVRPVARHFLSQSLPFAACPNEACAHHGVNAFEHLGKRVGGAPEPLPPGEAAPPGLSRVRALRAFRRRFLDRHRPRLAPHQGHPRERRETAVVHVQEGDPLARPDRYRPPGRTQEAADPAGGSVLPAAVRHRRAPAQPGGTPSC